MLPAVVRPVIPRAAWRPSTPANLPPLRAVRLLDQLRERVRMLPYSRRTEQAYLYWSRAFIRFHGLRHPAEMGGPEVEAFMTHLASDRGLSPSSHRQALSALLFLYGKVLGLQLPWMQEIGRPVPKRRLPVVLSVDEVLSVLARLQGEHQLLARLLYGTGLRIAEALSLRVKDIDFAQRAIYVRQGKGGKDRVVMLPQSLVLPLREQLGRVRQVWAADVESGHAGVELPYALERKYPRAGASWGWFWVFPQDHQSTDPAAASFAGTISTTRPFSARSSARFRRQPSTSPPRRTRCGTALRRICFRREATSARCRNCSGTPMWRRP